MLVVESFEILLNCDATMSYLSNELFFVIKIDGHTNVTVNKIKDTKDAAVVDSHTAKMVSVVNVRVLF